VNVSGLPQGSGEQPGPEKMAHAKRYRMHRNVYEAGAPEQMQEP
jgi:hypothetical protein